MKKNIITALVVAGAMLMSAPVYAASQKTETENTTEGNAQVIGGVDGSTDIFIDGGWEANTGGTSIDAKENAAAKKAYEKAMDDFAGDSFEVIAYLGSQVVAGTNYCYLCREASDESDPLTSFVLLSVYEDLNGNAEVTDVKDVFPFWDEEYDYPDGDQIETEEASADSSVEEGAESVDENSTESSAK